MRFPTLPRPSRQTLKKIALISSISGVVFLLVIVIQAERKISGLVLGGLGESFSTKVYSAPTSLKTGAPQSLPMIQRRLQRLRYAPTDETIPLPGQYKIQPEELEVYLRGYQTPLRRQNAILVKMKIDRHGLLRLSDALGNEVDEAGLEPELAAELSGETKIRRDPAHWEDFPPHLIHAVVAAEDHKFFGHWGIRPLAILRAFLHNLRSSGPLHGGSTITQQLAKNLFLTPERTIKRKILEAFFTLYLEIRFSKEKILTLYLNHIYMGQDGFVSVAGMKSAADLYFNKPLNRLTIGESAVLAGLIRSPYRYNPKIHPEESVKRRNFVLRNMREEGLIRTEEFETAVNEPLRASQVVKNGANQTENDYFIAEVMRRLSPVYGEDVLFRYGLTLYTTMDPVLQAEAQKAVSSSRFQGALVSIDPETGRVLALVGGKNFKESQFNRATQALRQPGSAFKPFVYGAAMEKGFSPSSFVQDQFRSYPGAEKNELWSPRNFDDVYLGTVTLRTALSQSRNTATLDLIEKIRPETALSFARRAGITSPLKPDLALGLGVYEVSLLELTAAYAPFINGGFRIKPLMIETVVDSRGSVVELDTVDRTSVMDPALSYLITSLLTEVTETGTAKSLKSRGWPYPTAGKTGTTNGGKDAWFVGYTPFALSGVWVGNDEAKAVRAAGSAHALPVWASFMKGGFSGYPEMEFSRPDGLVKLSIDPETNMLSRTGCPDKVDEWFLPETAPKEKCSLHPGGIKGFFKNLFGNKD